jgi:exosortase/archaeosortase family protein
MRTWASSHLARFAGIMILAYGAWFVLYDLWILPDGRLDEALSLFVASATGALVGLGSDAVVADGRVVWLGQQGIEVANGCNGLSTLSLFVGFVLAYPGAWRRRALFVPFGLAVLVAANIVRCVVLLVLLNQRPEWFDAAHSEHSVWVFYAVVFGLWVLWTHVGDRPAEAERVVPAVRVEAA